MGAILNCDKRRVPIRIWISLEELTPEEDIVIGSEGILELVIGLVPNELTTISRINKTEIISQNSRPLLNYAPMRMKPDRTLFYPNAYDSVNRAKYYDYKAKLINARI